MRLEGENLILQLADRTSLRIAKRLGGLFHGANHRRRAAKQDLVLGDGAREALLVKSC